MSNGWLKSLETQIANRKNQEAKLWEELDRVTREIKHAEAFLKHMRESGVTEGADVAVVGTEPVAPKRRRYDKHGMREPVASVRGSGITKTLIGALRTYGKSQKGITAKRLVAILASQKRHAGMDVASTRRRACIVLADASRSEKWKGRVLRVSRGHYRWSG